MRNVDRADLVNKLLELTREGKLNWEGTLRQNRFAIHFPRSSVSISEGMDFDLGDAAFLEITNNKAEVVEKILFDDIAKSGNDAALMEARKALNDLYDMARESAVGIEKSVQDVMSQLETLEKA